jgi:hypothetical protein
MAKLELSLGEVNDVNKETLTSYGHLKNNIPMSNDLLYNQITYMSTRTPLDLIVRSKLSPHALINYVIMRKWCEIFKIICAISTTFVIRISDGICINQL